MTELQSYRLADARQDSADGSSEARASFTLLGATPFHIDSDGTLAWTYPHDAMRLMRCRVESLPATQDSLNQRLDHAARRVRITALRSLTWDGARYCISYRIDGMDGRRVWVEERGQRLSGDGAKPHDITAVITDIDSRRTEQAKAVYTARYDPLTELWNVHSLMEAVGILHKSLQYFRRNGALLSIRISNLADINSSYGYDTGDHLIQAVAERLRERINAPDLLGRQGGVRFGLALADCELDEVTARAQKILTLLSDIPYASPHGNLYADFNIAAVMIGGEQPVDLDALKARSEATLSAAKEQSERFVIFDPQKHSPSAPHIRDRTKPEDIISALNDRRVSLAYQPIVDAKTRVLHHYECLLRLKRGSGEVVSAGGFIMAAERLGLVHLLDRRALEIASETLLRYPEINLALNVSAATVKDLETSNAYLDALRALGPATSRVTLELTETVALEDPAMASRFSVEARMLGCEFSIDDFGSGYTTFQNLMAIEADSVKIDGSFIADLSMIPHKQTFVRMMVDLAQTFGVKTVAEMVETHEDADLLKRLGVDYLQGYLFGVPSAAPAWERDTGGRA